LTVQDNLKFIKYSQIVILASDKPTVYQLRQLCTENTAKELVWPHKTGYTIVGMVNSYPKTPIAYLYLVVGNSNTHRTTHIKWKTDISRVQVMLARKTVRRSSCDPI